MKKTMTGDEAKKRVIRQVAIMRHDYTKLYQQYREVVHENALLNQELDRFRRGAYE